MENFLKAKAYDYIFNLIVNFLKILLVYYFFSIFAIYAIGFCLIIIEYLKNGSLDNMYSLFNDGTSPMQLFNWIINGIKECIPFNKIFTASIDDYSNLLSSLFEFCDNLFDAETRDMTLKEYLGYLYRDVTITSIFSLIIFLYGRVKAFFKLNEKIGTRIAIFLADFYWIVAAFCLSSCFIKVFEHFLIPEAISVFYFFVIVISWLVHIALLYLASIKNGIPLSKICIVLVFELLFDTLLAFALWWLASNLSFNLQGMPNFESIFYSFLKFFLVAFIIAVIEEIKRVLRNKCTFSIFEKNYFKNVLPFLKNGKAK